VSTDGRSAQAIVHDVRQELIDLAENCREKDPALAAKLLDLSERLARVQGLNAAPTTSSYRHQVHMFQRWLRERGQSDEPPIDAATVLSYLRERSSTIASITLRKDAMGIRRWHQAEGLPDPTDEEALATFFTELGEAWSAATKVDGTSEATPLDANDGDAEPEPDLEPEPDA
jgi:hypothetical protein